MSKLLTAKAVLAGQKVIYVAEPGELIELVPDASRAIIVHPDRPPKFLNFDGTTEPFKPFPWTESQFAAPTNRLSVLLAE
jgi:hypothetical protein